MRRPSMRQFEAAVAERGVFVDHELAALEWASWFNSHRL